MAAINDYSNITSKFIKIMEKKNLLLKYHSINVCEIALMVCKKISLTEYEIEIIKTAALLHDIGKIFIDNSVLDKPSELSNNEFKMIMEHPTNGKDLAGLFIEDKNILEIILSHHERVDGKGYPRGLKNKKIPLGAKIISIADSYDAMVTKRPYRKQPMTKFEALAEIERCSGSQFDKDISKLFIKKLIKDELILNLK